MGYAWETYQSLISGEIQRLPHGFWSRPTGVTRLIEIVRHQCNVEGIHPSRVRRADLKRWRLDAGIIQLFNGSMIQLREFASTGYPDAPKLEKIKDERKARKALTNEIMSAVWARDEGMCVECGSTDDLQFDHMVPYSKGGSSTVENLRILCQPCNSSRGNKI
jgi:hypothetical protein